MKQQLTLKPFRWVVVCAVALGLLAYKHLYLMLGLSFAVLCWVEAGPIGIAERTSGGAINPQNGGNVWMFFVAACALLCAWCLGYRLRLSEKQSLKRAPVTSGPCVISVLETLTTPENPRFVFDDEVDTNPLIYAGELTLQPTS